MNKAFKYGHLYSLTSGATPAASAMTAGEIALNLHPQDTHIFAFDGTNVIDLGAKIGGKGDEKTVDTQLVDGKTIISSLVYLKDVTADETAGLPANVQKRFRLVNAQGENVVTSGNSEAGITSNTSDFIDIYKDSSIIEIYVGTEWDSVNDTTGVIDKKKEGDPITDPDDPSHTEVTEDDFKYLNYVYFAGGFSGETSGDSKYYMTQIDLDKFMKEGQYASGVTTNAKGIVTGVVDTRSEKVVSAWTDGDYDAEGTGVADADVLSVGESGFSVANIQSAINARHANVIKMNGYDPAHIADNEDVFEITSGDTIMKAIQKIEDKIITNGTGTGDMPAGYTNNTGILFLQGSDDTVILNAGQF